MNRIWIDKEISTYEWEYGISLRNIVDLLNGFGENEDVEFIINSPGGDVFAGIAISNVIKARKAKTTARVIGIAASMASVIACACDDIVMDTGTFLMIHNPWTLSVGNAEDLRDTADILDKLRDSILAFYRSKFSKTDDEIKALMDDETWIGAEEVGKYGLSATTTEPTLQVAACLTHRSFDHLPKGAERFIKVCDMKKIKEEEKKPEKEDDKDEEKKEEQKCEEPSDPVALLSDKLNEAEAKRRDFQSQRDQAEAELAKVKALKKDLEDKLSDALEQVKDLQGRLARTCLNTLSEHQEGKRARSWPDAVKECGSYVRAIEKYPALAEEYRNSHAEKDN